ncbi:HRDC domain-containing protein [Methylomonas sp. AM2-LC]|uniref:HRDC domain-containing protein n=1 Tax=Methylomonas sp. AM2-LC TaxID=3153301 RepID=UPI003264323D
MKYKFFAIPATNPESIESQLNAFCSSHRISFIEKHLVMDGANSFWSFCIAWLEGDGVPSTAINSSAKATVDYKQILSEVDFALYVELRNFRKDLAEQQNVPPYALFTNEQLAVMIQQRITTKGWRKQNLSVHPPILV